MAIDNASGMQANHDEKETRKHVGICKDRQEEKDAHDSTASGEGSSFKVQWKNAGRSQHPWLPND